MNLDNQRLREIQQLKIGYKHLLKETTDKKDIEVFQNILRTLEDEEMEIVGRSS